jgi:selenide,water dikinase
VRTDAGLQVLGHPGLFAAGDCGVIADRPRPPSGVWAVRAAPALAANLGRHLEGRPLRVWRPQARALQLLGDGGVGPGGPRALACWGPLVFGPSRWLWRWKESLDQAFLRRLAAPPAWGAAAEVSPCRGCAAKLPAEILGAALARLAAEGRPPASEDAAVLGRGQDGSLWLQSVDGFPALLSDPWRNARLTTLHACSDLWACGAAVASAQALVTLPVAAAAIQEELLLQSLAGVRSVLDPLGAPLLGGHTLEARDGAGLSLALTVNGRMEGERPWPKGPLAPGDALLLSRPLGSGVLFAAAMAGAARPEWIDDTLAILERSQAPLVEVLAAHGCRACTDVTGFGLLGHLGEMLAGADPDTTVALRAGAIPTLPGAPELLRQGHASSLAPANAAALALLEGPVRWLGGEAWQEQLLIDPQTCGPLLAALPAAQAPAALAALRALGFREASLIGEVGSRS